MKLQIEMPTVDECAVTHCAYNVSRSCQARAITVGDGIHPACDTYLPGTHHVTDRHQSAGVGACKVEACVHNRDLECEADAIRLTAHSGHADCATFSRN